jgi:DNA adenine methylase
VVRGPAFPSFRFLRSKRKLVGRIVAIARSVGADTVLDAFAGSCCVAYELKRCGFGVTANDVLRFPFHIALGVIVNDERGRLSEQDVTRLTGAAPVGHETFAAQTFKGLYFSDADNAFIDRLWANLGPLTPERRALALAAMYRACVQKRPRGVFSYVGHRYDDGRAAFRKPLVELFVESVSAWNGALFSTGRSHSATNLDVARASFGHHDLVYLDPPYLTRSSADEYGYRYHFLEGLSSYWRHLPVQYETRTRKLRTPQTAFHNVERAGAALSDVLDRARESAVLVSCASRSRPGVDDIVRLFRRHGRRVTVERIEHQYSVGRSGDRSTRRNLTDEYLALAE